MAHRPFGARAGVSVMITEYFYDLTLNSTPSTTSASFNYFITHFNTSLTASGPGNVSIPLTTTLTRGQTYQFGIFLQVSVIATSGHSSASFATISMQAPDTVRLKMATVR